MLRYDLMGVAGLLALSAFSFAASVPAETRAGTGVAAATEFVTATTHASPVGIAVKPGQKQTKDSDKPFRVQQKKCEPGAKWLTIGYFSSRAAAEKEKARCERQDMEDGHRDYEFQVVNAQDARTPILLPKKK